MVYRHNLDNQDDGISAYFNGDPSSAFTVSAVTPGNDQIDLDVGVNYQIKLNFALFAGYQGLFREDLTSHGISAGLRYAFGAAPAPAPEPAPPATAATPATA